MSEPVVSKDAQRKAIIAGGSASGALAIIAAVAIAVPDAAHWEGKRNLPYRDIVGVKTVCYGETQVPMRAYSDAECKAMLERRLRDDYMIPVAQCVPQIADKPRVLAASTTLAYNIGVKGFCGSTAAKRFRAGQFRAGCEAFLAWNKAGGRVINGLVKRREYERARCLSGVS